MTAGIRLSRFGMPLAAAVLLLSSAWAQSQQQPAAGSVAHIVPKAVPLVSDACPAVQRGGRIALDWNPNFDPAGAVSGLGGFELRFRELDADQVNLTQGKPQLRLQSLAPPHRITSLGNGFFHIELTIPRTASYGVYRLVGAGAMAAVYPEYLDISPRPQMTNSPVQMRLCMTVVGPQPAGVAGAGY